MEKKPLPVVTPESVGIPSPAVLAFTKRLHGEGMNMHSHILLRHGKIISESYVRPFYREKKHRMYSVSKTFTSMAIGLLVGEGRISTDDRIIDYFPDKLPEKLYPHVAEMTIRDLLIMATPYSNVTYGTQYSDWAATFFNTQTSHPSGTIFAYDTSGSFILDVIVERVTGKPFLEYMGEKLFSEIGVSDDIRCVKSPEGYSWGGSGVMCTTRDLAKFALVVMNGGKYGDKQLIDADYVKAATSRQIDNNANGWCDGYTDGYGYGYQIWMTRDGSYSFLGMGDQLAIIIPKYDILFVCTADNQGNPTSRARIYEALWSEILPHARQTALPEAPDAYNELILRCANLTPPTVNGARASLSAVEYGGRAFKLAPNRMGIKETRLSFDYGGGVWEYENGKGKMRVPFGIGCPRGFNFPDTGYYGDTIGTPLGRGYECLADAAWTEPHKLMLRVYAVDDYLGNFTVTFSFKGDEIAVYMNKTAEWFFDDYSGFAEGTKI